MDWEWQKVMKTFPPYWSTSNSRENLVLKQIAVTHCCIFHLPLPKLAYRTFIQTYVNLSSKYCRKSQAIKIMYLIAFYESCARDWRRFDPNYRHPMDGVSLDITVIYPTGLQRRTDLWNWFVEDNWWLILPQSSFRNKDLELYKAEEKPNFRFIGHPLQPSHTQQITCETWNTNTL